MPYPIAHPAAVVPLHRLLGRLSVPSALAIGSVVPDFWYVLPIFQRGDSHSPEGLFFFCLPVGFAAYILFHLLKAPALALLPRALAERLWACSPVLFPAASFTAVCVSLLLGAETHLLWDSLTGDELYGRIVRHGSTLLGGAFVIWWAAQKIKAAPRLHLERTLSPVLRKGILGGLLAISAVVFLQSARRFFPLELDYDTVRALARTAGIDAVGALAWGLVAYGLGWHVVRYRASRRFA